MDDDEPRRKVAHEIGTPLDALSIEELKERIALMEGEIVRLQQAITAKTASRAAADTFFKS